MSRSFKSVLASFGALALISAAASAAHAADAIPYPNSGSYNTTTYSFTATATGDVIAYFIGGSGAGFENQMGLLDNGVLTSAGFGLDNHSSAVGDSFNLGSVNAGDTLVFVLHNLSLGADAFSDPSLNAAYDSPGETLGHNHIYSTGYTADPTIASVPVGTYVAFEDLPFPGADFNYNDESFVFTNATVGPGVPEPSTWAMMLMGLGGLGAVVRGARRRQAAVA